MINFKRRKLPQTYQTSSSTKEKIFKPPSPVVKFMLYPAVSSHGIMYKKS